MVLRVLCALYSQLSVFNEVVQLGGCRDTDEKTIGRERKMKTTLPLGQYIPVSLRLDASGLLDCTRTHERPSPGPVVIFVRYLPIWPWKIWEENRKSFLASLPANAPHVAAAERPHRRRVPLWHEWHAGGPWGAPERRQEDVEGETLTHSHGRSALANTQEAHAVVLHELHFGHVVESHHLLGAMPGVVTVVAVGVVALVVGSARLLAA